MTRSHSFVIRVSNSAPVEVIAPPFERNPDGTLTDAWWSALPLRTIVKVPGTTPFVTLQPLLDAVTNELGEKYRDHGVERMYGMWADWTGASHDPRGHLHICGTGGHAGSSFSGVASIDLERLLGWRLSVKPMVITKAMIDAMIAQAIIDKRPINWGGGRVDYGWHGDKIAQGAFYRDHLGREAPTAQHTELQTPWDEKRNRVFAHRYGAFIAWLPDQEPGWVKLGPQYAAPNFGRIISDPVKDLMYQFANNDGLNVWQYRAVDPETGTILQKYTFPAPFDGSPTVNHGFLDGTCLVNREICSFRPHVPISFAINLDTHAVRKINIAYPSGMAGTAGVVHLDGSEVLMITRQTTDGVTRDVLLLADVERETCVPYQHAGLLPPSSVNGIYGRFFHYRKRRIVGFTTRHDTDVRIMRLA